MKLTRGQANTLYHMHTDPKDFSDEALREFFAYTDRGDRSCFTQYEGTPMVGYFLDRSLETAELYSRFQWCGMRDQAWTVQFNEGTLFPWDFADCEWREDFEAARRIDTVRCGYERAIWKELAHE